MNYRILKARLHGNFAPFRALIKTGNQDFFIGRPGKADLTAATT